MSDSTVSTPGRRVLPAFWFAACAALAAASTIALRATNDAQSAVNAQTQARLAGKDDLRLVGPAGEPVVLHDALGNDALKRRYHFLILLSSAAVLATLWCGYRGWGYLRLRAEGG